MKSLLFSGMKARTKEFLLNFLSVFLGIVLTFAGEAWISHSKEKKDLKAAMHLIADELEDNRTGFTVLDSLFRLEKRAVVYLILNEDRYDACNPDSLGYYCNMPLSIMPASITSEALELLKTSAMFKDIRDKELALDIIRVYRALSVEKEQIEYFYEKKQKFIDAAMQKEAKALFARTGFTPAEMWTAITSTPEGKQFLNELYISLETGFNYKYVDAVTENVISRVRDFAR